MKALGYHNRPRKLANQCAIMARLWPSFDYSVHEDGCVSWMGKVRGFQQFYKIAVIWSPVDKDAPCVMLLDPKLKPREGGSFEDIPHLWFNVKDPENSALCLFDPEQNQWDDTMAIAETTVFWAARWLLYYEYWHLTGEWFGGGVGHESIAKAKQSNVH